MKTKFLRYIAAFLAAVAVLSCAISAASAEWDKSVIVTSHCGDSSITFRLDGTTMNVSGTVSRVSGLNAVGISYVDCRTGEARTYAIETREGTEFSAQIKVERLADTMQLGIYVRVDGNDGFILFSGPVAEITSSGTKFYFSEPEAYSENLKFDSVWRNPADYLAPADEDVYRLGIDLFTGRETGVKTFASYAMRFFSLASNEVNTVEIMSSTSGTKLTPESEELVREMADTINETRRQLRELGSEIVGGAKDDYEKLRLLSTWTADNLYYDMRVLQNPAVVKNDLPSVLKDRITVCRGYADFLCMLLREQGIPAYTVFCSNPDEDDVMNHDFVEAFIDGRWVEADPTWDSLNSYSNGKKNRAPALPAYFDMTEEVFSLTHRKMQLTDGLPTDEDIPSDWAIGEVGAAFGANIVPYPLQGDYRNEITREEFCTLVVRMLCRINGTSGADGLLEKRGVQATDTPFADTDSRDVRAASVLGIVNGVGDGLFNPEGRLTREQAATMLMRAAKLLGLESDGKERRFGDGDEISAWAGEGVAFVSGLVSADGAAVMGGTGEGRFSPKSGYTREQSILTVFRLLRCL